MKEIITMHHLIHNKEEMQLNKIPKNFSKIKLKPKKNQINDFCKIKNFKKLQ